MELEQLGIPHDELMRESIRVLLRRNYRALNPEEKTKADHAIQPPHLDEIQSVYRLNGSYKGDEVKEEDAAAAGQE